MNIKLYRTYEDTKISYILTKYKDKIRFLKEKRVLILISENFDNIITEDICMIGKAGQYIFDNKEIVSIINNIYNTFNLSNIEIKVPIETELIKTFVPNIEGKRTMELTFDNMDIAKVVLFVYKYEDFYCKIKLSNENSYFNFKYGSIMESNIEIDKLLDIISNNLLK